MKLDSKTISALAERLQQAGIARLALQRALLHWIELDIHLAWCDERVSGLAETIAKPLV